MSDKVRKTCGIVLLAITAGMLVIGFLPGQQREPETLNGRQMTEIVLPGLKELAPDSLINTGNAVMLEQLPGIGPVTAQAIVKERDEHGPFVFPEELECVHGIGEAKMEQIRELLIADPGESEE